MDELSRRLARARAAWTHVGDGRPAFARQPGPGQESVWDYPRPPRLAPDPRRVRVVAAGVCIADTTRAIRVLETASPPTFYLPPDDVDTRYLEPAPGQSHCEWKGTARYFTVRVGDAVFERVAWAYPTPYPEYVALAGYLSFYPARLECTVDGQRVRPQPGGFYGGWITDEIVGPVKGEPGSGGW